MLPFFPATLDPLLWLQKGGVLRFATASLLLTPPANYNPRSPPPGELTRRKSRKSLIPACSPVRHLPFGEAANRSSPFLTRQFATLLRVAKWRTGRLPTQNGGSSSSPVVVASHVKNFAFFGPRSTRTSPSLTRFMSQARA